MAVDDSLLGRVFPPTTPHSVTADSVRAFAEAVGAAYDPTGNETGNENGLPPTYPIVVAFDAMMSFLDEAGFDLHHIVHGEQRFAYERPIRIGDELSAQLTVASVRTMGGADIIGTSSVITDARGDVVCTGKATLLHSGPAAGGQG